MELDSGVDEDLVFEEPHLHGPMWAVEEEVSPAARIQDYRDMHHPRIHRSMERGDNHHTTHILRNQRKRKSLTC